jgi:hypothetical protein
MQVQVVSKKISLWPFVVIDIEDPTKGLVVGWIWWAVIFQF